MLELTPSELRGYRSGLRSNRAVSWINFTTSLNAEMKKLFVAVTIVCMGTILVSISAQTPSASPDASTDEEGIADEVTDRTEQCDCPSSPDGKFAFVLSFGEKDAFEDRPQILDLIEKRVREKAATHRRRGNARFVECALGTRFEWVRFEDKGGNTSEA